ncbi:hypothetical protein C6A85_000000115575 [Mycobacterium sp. ITM-2017-0098]|nr:hypothetical protein C6A85_000000115575 [Mycobacterium sp. ITM-2017-0098]
MVRGYVAAEGFELSDRVVLGGAESPCGKFYENLESGDPAGHQSAASLELCIIPAHMPGAK